MKHDGYRQTSADSEESCPPESVIISKALMWAGDAFTTMVRDQIHDHVLYCSCHHLTMAG